MKKNSKSFFKLYSVVALTGLGLLASASLASAAVDKVRCIVWQGDPAKQHTAISGQSARLKAVIDTDNTSMIWYRWVYGDGTSSAVSSASGSKRYKVAIDKVYTAATGTPFTAKLQVDATSNAMTNVVEDTYLIKVEDNNLDTRVNIAIDNGLWWLYQQGGNHGYSSYPHTYDGSPQMTWVQTSSVYTLATPTASAIQAFGINGHKTKGNVNEDPYVEAVQQGMNYLVKGYNYYTSYPALRARSITSVNHGGVIDNPETDQASPNGYGVEVYDWGGSHIPYQSGQIMDAIIASGVSPSDLTGRDFTRNDSTIVVRNWTYGELLQDMADMHAWGQSDSTGCNGGVCGSWWYGWNYGFPGDNSASQWGAIGMLPAQQAPWDVVVPSWVKNYNSNWLAYSMGCTGPSAAVTSCSYSFFSYNGVGNCAGDSCEQTTTSGMVQMIFDGQTTVDLKWDRAEKYIADRWRDFTHLGSSWGGSKTYGWYSFAKAMRLSLPNPTTQLEKTSGATFDWYYGDPTTTACTTEANCEKGLAQRILEIQSADGQWASGNLTNPPLTTAWMIITLKPSLFASSPIACFDYNPKSTYSGATVSFDPSCSGHSEPGKTIADLTKFEWDWDNDGTYDEDTPTPGIVTNAFSCAAPPCTFPVTLQVTDDEGLTATVKQSVEITNPPHPPSAEAGGPYMTSLCAADSLTLDGSASSDPNEGTHEAGCTTCPDDTITAWDWDLTPPLTGFDNKSGETVTFTPAAYFTAGSHDIGLRVTDNTALAYPGSGDPNLTDTDFATVAVYDGCICTLNARAKAGKVQLTWTNIGAASYDIYRSTTGPNSGFTKIADDHVTTYATYLDGTVVSGTPYWYRVVASSGCGSVSKWIIPPVSR